MQKDEKHLKDRRLVDQVKLWSNLLSMTKKCKITHQLFKLHGV